jgi:hypothetical protein
MEWLVGQDAMIWMRISGGREEMCVIVRGCW